MLLSVGYLIYRLPLFVGAWNDGFRNLFWSCDLRWHMESPVWEGRTAGEELLIDPVSNPVFFTMDNA